MKHRYYRKWSWTKHCIWSTDDADSLGQELEAISAWCKGAHYNINIRAVYEVLNPNRLNPFYFCCWPQSTFLLCQKHLKIVFFAQIFLNVCIYKLTRNRNGGTCRLTTYLEHREDVVMPETSICEIYFWNIAKQFFCVDFTKDEVVL